MILKARRRGTPSVYVPHAPAALNRIYGDLPADLCLLANIGDPDYYLGLGAATDRMEVIGDPVASPATAPAAVAGRGPRTIVFATTADRPPGMLRSALLAASRWGEEAGLPLVVAAHPRDRTLAQQVIGEFGLTMHDGRTDQLFAQRDVAVFVTEAASGVALAAVRAGVPVLRWSGVPNYVFEERLGIASVDEAGSEILDAVRGVRESAEAGVWPAAGPWVGPVGDEAVAAREALLSGAVRAEGPALDSWNHWAWNHWA